MLIYKCYTNGRGDNEIAKWYQSLPPKHQGKVFARMEMLKNSTKQQWDQHPKVSLQAGKGKDLYEVKFSLGIEFRILGYFTEDEKTFIMLLCHTKKGKSDNTRGFAQAAARRKEIKHGTKETEEYEFTDDEIIAETIH